VKLAVINPGGGAAGSEQFGALKALMAAGIKPDAFYGTSIGSFNTAIVSHAGIEATEALWRGIKSVDDVLEANWWVSVPWKTGLRYPNPISKKMHALIDGKPAQIPYTVTVTDLYAREPLFVPHTDPDIFNMIIASGRLPGYVELYQPPGQAYCDGGVVVNLPLKQAIQDGYDLCVCLHCTPQDQTKGDMWKPGNPLTNALRAWDVSADRAYLDERDISKMDLGARPVHVFDVYCKDNSISTLDFNQKQIELGLSRGPENAAPIIPLILDMLQNQSGAKVG